MKEGKLLFSVFLRKNSYTIVKDRAVGEILLRSSYLNMHQNIKYQKTGLNHDFEASMKLRICLKQNSYGLLE